MIDRPAGAVQASLVADEVSRVHLLDAPRIVRHQSGYLLKSVVILRDSELRDDEHTVSLEPVDVRPAVHMWSCRVEVQFHNIAEVRLQALTDSFCHKRVKLSIVRHQHGALVYDPADAVRVAIDIRRVPGDEDDLGEEGVLQHVGELASADSWVLAEDLGSHNYLVLAVDGIPAVYLNPVDEELARYVGTLGYGQAIGDGSPVGCGVEKIVRPVGEGRIAVHAGLHGHIVTAPDVLGAVQKGVAYIISVEDFDESLVCDRTCLRQECRKIHPVETSICDHMELLFYRPEFAFCGVAPWTQVIFFLPHFSDVFLDVATRFWIIQFMRTGSGLFLPEVIVLAIFYD